MGKAKMVGEFRPFLPNSRADMRRVKQYRRNREYTDRIEAALRNAQTKRYLPKKEKNCE